MRLFSSMVIVALLSPLATMAQKSPSKFGKIDKKNLQMTQAPIDSTAGAVVLFDFGYATYDHNFEIALEVHRRIKVFNSTQFDQGDIKIPYAQGDRIEKLKAASYNLEGGKVVESEVHRRDMFDEEVRDGVNQKRFSIPNVKEGTIIEYTYRVNYGGFSSLSPHYFQESIPVLYSEYVVRLPVYFTYRQLMTGYVPLTDVEKTKEVGHFNGGTFNVNVDKYVATNVPAFKDEPYMTTSDNYISKIQYKLYRVDIPGSVYEQYMPTSYQALSKGYAEGDYYGKSLQNNNFLDDIIAEQTAGLDSDEAKIKALYEYVRDNYEIDNEVMAEGLRRITNIKRGYRADLNRLLTSLLMESGYEASIVKLSTRDHGNLHPIYAARSNFNYTIACVELEDQTYLMDASSKGVPFGMLPKKCLNGKGLVISETNPRWVSLQPTKSDERMIFGNLEMDENGVITGKIDVSRKDYDAADFRSDHSEAIDKYKSGFKDSHTTWTIASHEIKDMENIDSPITESLELDIEGQAESLGNIIYLNPIAYGQIEENIFKTEKRLFPVDLGMPISRTLSYRIKIPEGFTVDELPKATAIGLPNNAGTFIYQVKSMNGFLNVTSKLDIRKAAFSTEEYPYLREFYTQVSAKHAEQVVLKKL